MIIACPSCSTRFKVAAARIQPTGTKVRCAECGHVWLQRPEEEPKQPHAAQEQAAPPQAAPEPAASAAEPLAPAEPSQAEPAPQAELPRQRIEAVRSQAPLLVPSESELEEPAEARVGIGRWALRVGWGVLLAAVLGGLGTGYFLRLDIVRSFPKTGALYRLVGVEVNLVGIDFRNVTAERGIENGKAAVQLEGEIVNESGHRVAVPELRATIRDADGAALGDWTFEAFADSLGPREVSAFASSHAPLPAGAQNVELRFVTAK